MKKLKELNDDYAVETLGSALKVFPRCITRGTGSMEFMRLRKKNKAAASIKFPN